MNKVALCLVSLSLLAVAAPVQASPTAHQAFEIAPVALADQGVLVAAGVYLRLERSLTRIAVGLALLANGCRLYTSDAADGMQCVDLGGRRLTKTKGCEMTA